VAEFKILNNIVDHMESTGSTYKLVTLSIDEELVSEINNKNNTNFTLGELEKAADKCLAHEWLTHASLGGAKYGSLQITPKGVGASRSKLKSEELKASRSWLKKSSDSIEDHKGILIFLGAVIALASFILKVTGE
jgi:hypothetical protein